MSASVYESWPIDIDYDTVWLVVGKISDQIAGRGLKALAEKLEDEGLEMTGDLKRSLFREVKQNNQAWMTDIAIQFEGYGRFKDMKELHYSGAQPGRDYIDSMKKFVEAVMDGKKKNSKPFTHIADNLSFPADKQKAINSLAWALAKGRLKQPIVTRQGKGWYIKNYMKEIYGEIEINIQAAAAQATLNTMKKALKDR